MSIALTVKELARLIRESSCVYEVCEKVSCDMRTKVKAVNSNVTLSE